MLVWRWPKTCWFQALRDSLVLLSLERNQWPVVQALEMRWALSGWSTHIASNRKGLGLEVEGGEVWRSMGRWSDCKADRCVTVASGNKMRHGELANPRSSRSWMLVFPILRLVHVYAYPLKPRSMRPLSSMNLRKPPVLEVDTSRPPFLSAWSSIILKSPITIQGPENVAPILVLLSQNSARRQCVGGP